MTHLQIGDKAPNFKALNESEETIQLKDFKGQKLVLFFYPKADTPGCTKEACNLRDHFQELQGMGFALLGVSPDKPAKQMKFKTKYEFPFSLLADEDLTITNAYGIWGPKKFMGKEYDGLHRTTFIIDEKGKIAHIIKKVKTKEHAEQIVELYS